MKVCQNSKCDKIQSATKLKIIKMWHSLKTRSMTKLKNLKGDKTQKLIVWQNSNNQNVAKFKNSNCDKTENSKCDKTQKPKMWQYSNLKMLLNSKTQNVT